MRSKTSDSQGPTILKTNGGFCLTRLKICDLVPSQLKSAPEVGFFPCFLLTMLTHGNTPPLLGSWWWWWLVVAGWLAGWHGYGNWLRLSFSDLSLSSARTAPRAQRPPPPGRVPIAECRLPSTECRVPITDCRVVPLFAFSWVALNRWCNNNNKNNNNNNNRLIKLMMMLMILFAYNITLILIWHLYSGVITTIII